MHAIRTLARIGLGRVSVRWSQLGYGKTSSTTPAELTPRNLMGFKDGTGNIPYDDRAALDEHVWVAAADGPAWMTGGSYLVARRIRMHLEAWDQVTRQDQEATIGSDSQGRIDAGLFFLAYQRDPRRQFVPMQRRLATGDRLSAYIRHVGSGLWACPPGVSPGGYWGDTLLGSSAQQGPPQSSSGRIQPPGTSRASCSRSRSRSGPSGRSR